MDIKKLMSNWPKLEKPSAIFFFFFFYSTVTNLIGQNKKMELLSQYTQIILLTMFLYKNSSRSLTRSDFLRRERTFSPDILSLFLIFLKVRLLIFSSETFSVTLRQRTSISLSLYKIIFIANSSTKFVQTSRNPTNIF